MMASNYPRYEPEASTLDEKSFREREIETLQRYLSHVTEQEREMEELGFSLLQKIENMDQRADMMLIQLEKLKSLNQKRFHSSYYKKPAGNREPHGDKGKFSTTSEPQSHYSAFPDFFQFRSPVQGFDSDRYGSYISKQTMAKTAFSVPETNSLNAYTQDFSGQTLERTLGTDAPLKLEKPRCQPEINSLNNVQIPTSIEQEYAPAFSETREVNSFPICHSPTFQNEKEMEIPFQVTNKKNVPLFFNGTPYKKLEPSAFVIKEGHTVKSFEEPTSTNWNEYGVQGLTSPPEKEFPVVPSNGKHEMTAAATETIRDVQSTQSKIQQSNEMQQKADNESQIAKQSSEMQQKADNESQIAKQSTEMQQKADNESEIAKQNFQEREEEKVKKSDLTQVLLQHENTTNVSQQYQSEEDDDNVLLQSNKEIDTRSQNKEHEPNLLLQQEKNTDLLVPQKDNTHNDVMSHQDGKNNNSSSLHQKIEAKDDKSFIESPIRDIDEKNKKDSVLQSIPSTKNSDAKKTSVVRRKSSIKMDNKGVENSPKDSPISVKSPIDKKNRTKTRRKSRTKKSQPSTRKNSVLISEESSDSGGNFFGQSLPLISSAAYQSLIGATLITPKAPAHNVISDSESEDDVEKALAMAMQKTSAASKTENSPKKPHPLSDKPETVTDSKPTSAQTRKSSLLPSTASKMKLSKASRIALGLDSESDSVPVQSSIKKEVEEESDEFDFFNQ